MRYINYEKAWTLIQKENFSLIIKKTFLEKSAIVKKNNKIYHIFYSVGIKIIKNLNLVVLRKEKNLIAEYEYKKRK